MSSGEKAKPPATVEERNPFDISRRSGPEVAAEIAKRMAAWKQARARPSSAPIPNRSGTNQSGPIPSGDPKRPPIAAPVQPARMPKAARASQPAQTTSGSTGSAAPRAPFFAVSAIRRAMPPAPSLKQTRAPASRADGRAARTDEPAIMLSAPAREHAPRAQDEQSIQVAAAAILATTPEQPAAEWGPGDSTAIEEASLDARVAAAPVEPESSGMHPFESASAAEASEPTPPESTETERRRAEARALKARWIAARDLDPLLERPAATAAADIAQSVEAAGTASPDVGIASTRESQDVEKDLVRSSPEESDTSSEPDTAFEATARVGEPAHPAVPTAEPEATAVQTSPIAALDEAAGRKEPTFDASIARGVTPDAAPEARVEAADEIVVPLRAEAAEAPDLRSASHALSIAALDAVAGRKEPTFDRPVQSVALDDAETDASTEARDEAPIAPAEPARTLSAPVEAASEPPARGIDALERVAGRREPHFDEPVRPAVAAPAAAQKAHIKLRPIETRIEARRVDALRADPPLTACRPIFPHIEPEEWDVAPMVAARAGGERRGTGWAIGLGSLLLIAGITAPAAIWQQGRQLQDQVALVKPAPAPQQPLATPGAPAVDATMAQAPTQPSTQAALSAAPQPQGSRSKATALGVTAQQSSAPAPVEPKPVAAESDTADAASPTTTLRAIGNSDDVNEAPIVAPQSQIENLKTASTGTPMVARPFEPEQGNGPFLRVPTSGVATVPVTGAPVQSAAVGVKPNLIGQLKPRTSAVASASRPVASKPLQRRPKPFFQQSPDQMFETLIQTLSEGRPANPNTKPASPSNRR